LLLHVQTKDYDDYVNVDVYFGYPCHLQVKISLMII